MHAFSYSSGTQRSKVRYEGVFKIEALPGLPSSGGFLHFSSFLRLQNSWALGHIPADQPLSSHSHTPPGLSCHIRRRVGFPAHLDRPAWSHLKPLKGLHLQTPPSDSIPSRLPGCLCALRERCSSHHSTSFYFATNIQVTGAGVGSQLRALKLATWPGGAPGGSREGTWPDAPAKHAAGKGQALHTNALNLCFKFMRCIPCSRALS